MKSRPFRIRKITLLVFAIVAVVGCAAFGACASSTPVGSSCSDSDPSTCPSPTPTPTPSPLAAVFAGIARIATNDPNVGDLPSQPIDFAVRFSGDRSAVNITNFSPVTAGSVTISLAHADTGSYDRQTGALQLSLNLQFAPNAGCPLACPSDLPIDVSTDESVTTPSGISVRGLRMNEYGHLAMVGQGTFASDGSWGVHPLDGTTAVLLVRGTFTPSPIAPVVSTPTSDPSPVALTPSSTAMLLSSWTQGVMQASRRTSPPL